jgi:hypothetical protein
MSALDGRIRHIAREEAAALLGAGPAAASTQDAGGEVAELRSQVEALGARLDALEAAATAPAPAAKRGARKTAESTE